MVARLSPVQKVTCSTHVGVIHYVLSNQNEETHTKNRRIQADRLSLVGSVLMNAREKRILTKHFLPLVTETPVEEIVPYLQEKGVFSNEHAEDILFQNTQKNKVYQLLTILMRRRPSAYRVFIEALRSSDCSSLVALLE